MKRAAIILTCCITALGLSACVRTDESSYKDRKLIDYETTVFRELTIDAGDPVTAEFEVYLSENEGNIFYIEAAEDTDITLKYTYSTNDEDGVELGYYAEGEDSKTVFKLSPATDEAYDAIWSNDTVHLKKGMNIIYISGNDVTCKMYCEINDLDRSKITYVGGSPKDNQMEELPPLGVD